MSYFVFYHFDVPNISAIDPTFVSGGSYGGASMFGASKIGDAPCCGVPISDDIVGGPGVAPGCPGPGVGGDENTGSGDPATVEAGLVDNADPNLDPANSEPADPNLDSP